jgi:hypothetical protein
MYATSVGLILKGLEYLEENKTFARFGEKKAAPAAQTAQPQPVIEEPVQAAQPQSHHMSEEQYYDERPKSGTIGTRLRSFWDKIIEATDEKLDDTLN